MSDENKNDKQHGESEYEDLLLQANQRAQVSSPALWLAIAAVPLVLGLVIGLARSGDEGTIIYAQTVEPPAVTSLNTLARSGGEGGLSASNPVIAPAMLNVEKSTQEDEVFCDFSPWEGGAVMPEMLDKLKGASKPRPHRVIPPGYAVTQDFRPERVNFDVDQSGIITRIWCG